jgi:hypothetical protein
MYCKTDDHPEILIPCEQMYLHNYSSTFLTAAVNGSAARPWQERKPVLYNNPGGYNRWEAHARTRKLTNYTGRTDFPRQAFKQVGDAAGSEAGRCRKASCSTHACRQACRQM